MSILEKCGGCAHYKKVEGIFGHCEEKDCTAFASDPKCGVLFTPHSPKVVDGAAPSFADFGSRQAIDPKLLAFMGAVFPPGFMHRQTCQHKQEEPEPEKTEWENPLFRRKKKARKVINFAEAAAGRKNK